MAKSDELTLPGTERKPGKQIIALTVLLLVLCQSQQILATGGISLFLPLIRQNVGLDFTQGGTLAAASTLTYALMQIPAGYLADRFGARRLFLMGLIGSSVLSLSFALLHVYWLLVLNQAISGFFRALMFAPGLLLINALFPPNRRAMAMGLYVAGGSSSNVLLNIFGPYLVGPLGWRLLFVLFSLTGLLVTLLYWRFGYQGAGTVTGKPRPLRDLLSLFRYRAMWLIGSIQYVRLAVALGLQFWLPTFVVVEKGYSLQVAGLVVALGAALTVPSNFLGGYLSDRLRNPLLIIGTALAMLALTTVLLVRVENLVFLLFVCALNGVFVQLYFGPLFNVPIEMLGPEVAGLASGFGNFFANLGALTFTYTLGALKDATGSFDVGLYGIAALCLLALICTLLLARMKPLTREEAVPMRELP
ncbi:MAG TPA: MFS transporter [Ktedonobacteraceae bacterium]|jgi:DHA1 family inner membrane transport protein|nr:MFS transporter [Ktedonobacteraceae bacterium]